MSSLASPGSEVLTESRRCTGPKLWCVNSAISFDLSKEALLDDRLGLHVGMQASGAEGKPAACHFVPLRRHQLATLWSGRSLATNTALGKPPPVTGHCCRIKLLAASMRWPKFYPCAVCGGHAPTSAVTLDLQCSLQASTSAALLLSCSIAYGRLLNKQQQAGSAVSHQALLCASGYKELLRLRLTCNAVYHQSIRID